MPGSTTRRVVPRICATCVNCKHQMGRKFCDETGLSFRDKDELTTTCDKWRQAVLLTISSVHTVDGEEPAWLSELRTALIDERTKAKFYYDLCEESAKRKKPKRP